MNEITDIKKERAILVSVKTQEVSREKVAEYLDELEMLADTAGAETVFKVVQERSRIDSASFIGKGKAEEIAELVELNDINLLIFDDDLSPTQVRNLERIIEIKIIDRSGLILDIFASHAKTNQAKTQVELAQLQYLLPRLTRAWTHLSKQHGGIGTKGPGETQIETDRRLIRTRIAKLKDKLKKIELQQITSGMKRKEFVNAALVGYTNAGKSTLLNHLTDAKVLAENKLFATLDSTTRAFELAKNKKLLLSDTVGFIRKLPHHLVESFKTTLNVVRNADVILNVVDITHPFFEEHIAIVQKTLKELKCEDKKQLIVFNKADALNDNQKIAYINNIFPESILISAKRGMNIQQLINRLLKYYEEKFVENTISLHVSESKIISQIHNLAQILNTNYEDENVVLEIRTSSINAKKIESLLNEKKKNYS